MEFNTFPHGLLKENRVQLLARNNRNNSKVACMESQYMCRCAKRPAFILNERPWWGGAGVVLSLR